jgi:hypothetical protein
VIESSHENAGALNEAVGSIEMETEPVISEFAPAGFIDGASLKPRAKDMQDHMREMQSDAPACNVCGHITVRSGTCYKCLNCGNSLGCS